MLVEKKEVSIMAENLPVGFRFKPTDVELIDHYLRLKINGKHDQVTCISEVDICRVEPWDLPDMSAIKTHDHEWFFFCPRDRKYPNGERSNRATGTGYWKATGRDRNIKSKEAGLIGKKKSLVFHRGKAPKGQRTDWVIHEYSPTLQELDGTNPGQEPFVLCRLFKKADDLKKEVNDGGSNIVKIETTILPPNQPNVSEHDAHSKSADLQTSPESKEQPFAPSDIGDDWEWTIDEFLKGPLDDEEDPPNQTDISQQDSHSNPAAVKSSPGSAEQTFAQASHDIDTDEWWNINIPDFVDLPPANQDQTLCFEFGTPDSALTERDGRTGLASHRNIPKINELYQESNGYPNSGYTNSDDAVDHSRNFSDVDVPSFLQEFNPANYRSRDLNPTDFVQPGSAMMQKHLNSFERSLEHESSESLLNDRQDAGAGIKKQRYFQTIQPSFGVYDKKGTSPKRSSIRRRNAVKSFSADVSDEILERSCDDDLSDQKRSPYKKAMSVCVGIIMVAFLFIAPSPRASSFIVIVRGIPSTHGFPFHG